MFVPISDGSKIKLSILFITINLITLFQSTDGISIQSQTTTSKVTSGKQNILCRSSLSEISISDCGYGTQVENQESISTSSNDDDQPHQKPIHQKPHTFQKSRFNGGKSRATTALDKKELRRKKLVKRSKTNV